MEYGKHLLVEAIVKDYKPLSSVASIRSFFNLIIKELNFQVIGKPFIYKFPSRIKKMQGGITGMCVIGESHLSIHTWPESNYFAFDLFSCRNFNDKVLISLIKKSFKVNKLHSEIVIRGMRKNF